MPSIMNIAIVIIMKYGRVLYRGPMRTVNDRWVFIYRNWYLENKQLLLSRMRHVTVGLRGSIITVMAG